MVVAETAAGLSALKSAFDITKGMSKLNKDADFNLRLIELQQKIIEAQQAAMVSNERLSELQLELKDLRASQNDLSRYQLVDQGSETYVYQLRESDTSGEPPHKICPKCYANGRKSVLQFTDTFRGQKYFNCPECEQEFRLGRRNTDSGIMSSGGGGVDYTSF